MTAWKARRFWQGASAIEVPGGYGIDLDGRPARTPAKRILNVPTLALAETVAAEWAAQNEVLDSGSMPFTRLACMAIDKSSIARPAIEDQLAQYGNSDLLCYRCAEPTELFERQALAWDPALAWAESKLGARLWVTRGIVPIEQPVDGAEALRHAIEGFGTFGLTALFEVVTLSGSLVLGLGVLKGFRGPDEIWRLAQLDESWQQEKWGVDEEVSAMNEASFKAFRTACGFASLSGAGN